MDRGKQVEAPDGEVLGTITGICEGKAHVRPEATVPTRARREFTWADDGGVFVVDSSRVETIDNVVARVDPDP
jgi:hypothetical protein